MKRQRRIESFFSSQRENYTYFYMNFSTLSSEWLKEKPEGVVWEAEVQWSEMKLFVTLGCNHSPSDEEEERSRPGKMVDASFISLIKSNLQKCIRRRKSEKALSTALRFLEWDEGQFLRRLSIIMMEDVLLHSSLPTLVWLTAAHSKGFPLTSSTRDWLLTIVEYLCTEGKESYWSEDIYKENHEILQPTLLKEFYQSAKKHGKRNLLFSILFRKSYGGLQGDCVMMMAYVKALLEERCTVSTTPLASPSLMGARLMKPLDLADIELCSVDFHCYPQLIMILTRAGHSESELKGAIWHHNSKTNARVKQNSQSESIKEKASLILWRKIQYRVGNIQRDYISQCRNRHDYLTNVHQVF